MMRRVRAWVALGLGLGVAPWCGGCGGKGVVTTAKAAARPKVVTVTVAPLDHQPVERTVDVVGTLHGWEDVTLGAKRVGRVVKVFHDMGDRVPPGELLVELETRDADLAIEQAERQLQTELAKLGLKELPQRQFDFGTVPAVVQAKVSLERVRNNLARERTLSKRGAGTSQDLDNAENDTKGAEAALANAILNVDATLANAQTARVALELAKQARRDMEVRAPVPSHPPPGVTAPVMYALSKRSVSEGQMLKQGDAVVALVIEDPLRLWANVPERFSAEVRLGQPVRVSVAAYPDQTFAGTVARINPSVDPVSRTFQVEASVPNHSGMLRPGGFAKAAIVTRTHADAVVVPLESIVRFAGVTKLFIVEGDKARAIPVETGQEGTGWVEVAGPLPDKAHVVISGQSQLADGTEVVIQTPEAPKGE